MLGVILTMDLNQHEEESYVVTSSLLKSAFIYFSPSTRKSFSTGHNMFIGTKLSIEE